jgi:hypothetical protein
MCFSWYLLFASQAWILRNYLTYVYFGIQSVNLHWVLNCPAALLQYLNAISFLPACLILYTIRRIYSISGGLMGRRMQPYLNINIDTAYVVALIIYKVQMLRPWRLGHSRHFLCYQQRYTWSMNDRDWCTNAKQARRMHQRRLYRYHALSDLFISVSIYDNSLEQA